MCVFSLFLKKAHKKTNKKNKQHTHKYTQKQKKLLTNIYIESLKPFYYVYNFVYDFGAILIIENGKN